MQREFTAAYQKRGKWYVAWVEEVPGANTQGKTLREAKENLKEALKLVLDANSSLLRKSTRGAKVTKEPLRVSL